MQLKYNPIPETMPTPFAATGKRDIFRCELERAERLREKFITDTYEKNGALFWKSNDAPVPMDCFGDAFVEAPAEQARACEEDTKAFVKEYRRTRSNGKISAEQRFEMRAEFGPGETVVDVITGQKFRT